MLLEIATGPEDTADQHVDRARAILVAVMNAFGGEPMEASLHYVDIYYAIDGAVELLGQAQQAFDAATDGRIRGKNVSRNSISKAESLISAHRAAYDAWEPVLKQVGNYTPSKVPRALKRQEKALSAKEQRAQEALRSHVPATLVEAAAVARHIIPHAREDFITGEEVITFLESLGKATFDRGP